VFRDRLLFKLEDGEGEARFIIFAIDHLTLKMCLISGGYISCAFVLVTEYVGSRHRSAVGFGIWFAWIAGMLSLALLGYLIPNWRTLSIITSAPGILFFLFWW
jgi:hypothetical protein